MQCINDEKGVCEYIHAYFGHVTYTVNCQLGVDCPGFLRDVPEIKRHMLNNHRAMITSATNSGRGNSRNDHGHRGGAKINKGDVRHDQGPKNPNHKHVTSKQVTPKESNQCEKHATEDWNVPVPYEPVMQRSMKVRNVQESKASAQTNSAWETGSGMSSDVEAVQYNFNIHCTFMKNVHPPVEFNGLLINRVGCASSVRVSGSTFCAVHFEEAKQRKAAKEAKAAVRAARAATKVAGEQTVVTDVDPTEVVGW